MKIKELKDEGSLFAQAFYHPKTREIYFWYSQWEKGVWAKRDMNETKIYPIFVKSLSECLEWEVPE